MTEKLGTLQTIDDRPLLRFERRLAHPPEKVWRALTDPAEMRHWFPATVETEMKIGAPIRFHFEDQDLDDSEGEIVELDPPKVFAFLWDKDLLRWELVPDGDGCKLFFTHTFGGSDIWGDMVAAARHAAGWDGCLDLFSARLDGRTEESSMDRWFERYELYVDEFGLAEGEVRDRSDGHMVRFEREFYQPVDEVWATLVEQQNVAPGSDLPLRATNEYVTAGPVAVIEPGKLLAYPWLHEAAPAGEVRWEFIAHELGCRLVLTQTVPAREPDVLATALAAWQTHLELFVAAVNGKPRPWPHERTEELKVMYVDRLQERN